MKKPQRSAFKLNPITAAIVIAMAAQYPVTEALAGSGWGSGVDASNNPVTIPTYYANSPAGPVAKLDPVTGLVTINPVTGLPVVTSTGKALRKFVDTLPGIGAAKANNLGQYLPLAVAEKWVDLNGTVTTDDYYEIAAIEYSEKMHSDLPKATHLRGYVQLSTLKNPGKHIALTYPNGTPILDAAGAQVFAYDKPHHLGPIISAKKGTAVRVKFTNYLPVGGELFIPVDTTITGAGTGPDGVTPYTQNRTEIHLVGGDAPWISAGTPHQWIAPAGEAAAYAAGMGKGASNQNVPDMTDPGNGSTTLYFPNDLSARFMFYQDRTSGLTRLNSYAGLEAGYFITDDAEAKLIASGALPAESIPLIIEDKTFVPANIAQQDAKWDTTVWGQVGDLWFPHVYETNQDINAALGVNPVGRWDYGPLFWPIFNTLVGGGPLDALPDGSYDAVNKISHASFTPEALFDTPVINGTAYPTLTVSPKAYRFRVLNASNDRYINLGLYKADATVVAPQLDANGNAIFNAAGVQQFFTGTEVKTVPAIADSTGAPLVPNNVGAGLAYDPTCLCQYPTLLQNVNAAASGPVRAWPTDGRTGGSPDPLAVGPDMIAIGNDGGLLPNPVDIPSQPATYEANKRSITIGNLYGYGLLMGPSERADVIIDFSQYAGQTLIVYNDGPAPNPWGDERDDYYTGNPDLTGTGGTYSTKPGYGPNTRTMMQIKVAAVAPGAPAPVLFNPTPLLTELPAAYAASQANPIVPAVAYNNAFKTNDPDIYAHVATGSLAQPTLDFSSSGALNITGLTLGSSGGAGSGSGTGYDAVNPPTVTFNNVVNGVNCLSVGGTTASATATVDPKTHQVSAVTLNKDPITGFSGSGYTCAPLVTFTNSPLATMAGIGAQAFVVTSNFNSYPVHVMAEQELFDNTGRYNATGGMELPFTNANTQTTIPLNYIDSATEVLKDGEVQIWKFVDNGFWTNSIHFDFVDVQLINRVGWDGTVKPPSSNEVGWKDTLRLNQLEDVIVAMRAKHPVVPFGLPKSSRVQDPSKVLDATKGSGLGFTIDPLVASKNVLADYDNEFAWYSAILSHSENDLMRPIVFHPTVNKPDAPSNFVDALGNGIFSWTDPTPAGQVASPVGVVPAVAATLANPQNEIGFKILQATLQADGTLSAYAPIAKVPANVTSWTQPAVVAGASYEVVAYNVAGDSAPSVPFSDVVPLAPLNFAATAGTFNAVTLGWANQTTTNTLQVWRSVNGGASTLITTLPGTALGFVDNAANAALLKYTPVVSALVNYTYEIKAVNALGIASSGIQAVTTPMEFVATPTLVSALPNTAGTQVTLRWMDKANNETAYLVEWSTDGVNFTSLPLITRSIAQKTAIGATLTSVIPTIPGSNYTFRVTAVNSTTNNTMVPANTAISNSLPLVTMVDLSAPVAPAAPTGLQAVLASATTVNLSWLDNATNENSYLVTITNLTTNVTTTATVTRNTTQSLASGVNVPTSVPVVSGNSYSFTVTAQASKFGLTSASTVAGPVTVDVMAPALPTNVVATPALPASGSITVNWLDAPKNATNYTVQRRTITVVGGVPTMGPFGNVGTVLPGLQTFVDAGRTIGRTYQYQVRANGVVGNLGFVVSNQVVAQ